MVRFIMVNATHSVIKYSGRIRKKYFSIVKTLVNNRAIIALSRIPIENIYTMLKNCTEFIARIDALNEREMVSMRSRASKSHQIHTIEDLMNNLRRWFRMIGEREMVQKER